MAKSASERLKAHVLRRGGRRSTYVLSGTAVVALELLLEEGGFKNETEAVNYALVHAAVCKQKPEPV